MQHVLLTPDMNIYIPKCVCVCVNVHVRTCINSTHTRNSWYEIYIYIYQTVCVCVCVNVCMRMKTRTRITPTLTRNSWDAPLWARGDRDAWVGTSGGWAGPPPGAPSCPHLVCQTDSAAGSCPGSPRRPPEGSASPCGTWGRGSSRACPRGGAAHSRAGSARRSCGGRAGPWGGGSARGRSCTRGTPPEACRAACHS